MSPARFRRAVGTLRAHARRYGAARALHVLAFQRLEDSGRLRVGWCNRVPAEGLRTRTPAPARGTVRRLGLDEIDGLARSAPHWFFADSRTLAEREGDLCYGLFDGGTLASTCWFARAPRLQVGQHLQLRDDTVLSHRNFTLPAYRGRGLLEQVYGHALGELRREGVRWCVNVTMWTNDASMAAFRRMGFERFGVLVEAAFGARATTRAYQWTPPYLIAAARAAPRPSPADERPAQEAPPS